VDEGLALPKVHPIEAVMATRLVFGVTAETDRVVRGVGATKKIGNDMVDLQGRFVVALASAGGAAVGAEELLVGADLLLDGLGKLVAASFAQIPP
jgi:hypothetical protein